MKIVAYPHDRGLCIVKVDNLLDTINQCKYLEGAHLLSNVQAATKTNSTRKEIMMHPNLV